MLHHFSGSHFKASNRSISVVVRAFREHSDRLQAEIRVGIVETTGGYLPLQPFDSAPVVAPGCGEAVKPLPRDSALSHAVDLW